MTVSLAEATAAARRIQEEAHVEDERGLPRGYYADARLLAGFVLAGDTERLRAALEAVGCRGAAPGGGYCAGPNATGDEAEWPKCIVCAALAQGAAVTGPHLTPEREADRWPCGCVKGETPHGAGWRDCPNVPRRLNELAAALDAEREAHQQARTALEASTAYLTKAVAHLVDPALWPEWRTNANAQVQENQRVLGLAVAEADKPHDGNER